ncbi:hypothetical protein [Streptomyces spectabilis]|uniref:Mucin-1 n=1 Tax=Streptomyces spectabilis TaxID=68270 RepID=A0A5P2XN15_STRST|nr:hypothetical protein [Streptomyces spectabilis]MBB5108315.1 hypothetical protein [Streptomyces spectabilis]MCI3901074.1 hypothetical protein [Streptomyces spectabilis]QEV64525.1 hypothetical protein CP982_07465 [Streptomyces spectabilis]GGV45816.1 hypothetical protein GCM10010245_71770 [Streptomyces spectabilis]
MQKIPTLFVRNPDDRRHVLPEVTSGCEWVLEGYGTATRKYDGTCVLLDESGDWWARREVKRGKAPPPNYVPIEHDTTTGKTVGWEPIAQSSFAKFHTEAAEIHRHWPHGTYELCGPKINGNPEGVERHTLIRHVTAETVDPRLDFRTYDEIGNFLAGHTWEGLVYHHPDGTMAKIKARDFPGAEAP